MHIPLIYEHLFYKHFVRRFDGEATNGINVNIKCLNQGDLVKTRMTISISRNVTETFRTLSQLGAEKVAFSPKSDGRMDIRTDGR